MTVPMLLAIVLVQMPLMLMLPVVIGLLLKRRYGIGWRVFLWGGLTFVLSQVVHLPLNYAVGLLNGQWGAGLWPLLPMALAAGLSAGVCETATRWAMLRFALRHVRGWRSALQFGAGHGGIESIIVGLLALSSIVPMVILQQSGAEALGLAGEQAAQAEQAALAFWSAPWYTSVLAGLERLFAITLHIVVAVLVMRAITRRQPGYLAAAVAAHTLCDTWAVYGIRTAGLVWTEVGLAVIAAVSLWLIIRLREEPGEEASP